MQDCPQPRVNELAPSIKQPPLDDATFQLIPVMLQMLQAKGQFGGKGHEDPLQHLMNFISVCSLRERNTLNITYDAIRLCLFPYSLTENAQAWLNSLPPNSICTWEQLASKFLSKYFPATRTMKLRNDIMFFRQNEQEQLYEAWDRFNGMLIRFPHHGIPDLTVMKMFYTGLNETTRSMVDSSAGGAFMKKTFADAKVLLDTMAQNGYSWTSSDTDANPTAIASAFNEPKVSINDMMSMLTEQLSTLNKKVDELTYIKQQNTKDHPNAHCQDYCTSSEEATKYTNNFNSNQGGSQWNIPKRDYQQWKPNQTWNDSFGGNEQWKNNQGVNQWNSEQGCNGGVVSSLSLGYNYPGFSSPIQPQRYYNQSQQRYPPQHSELPYGGILSQNEVYESLVGIKEQKKAHSIAIKNIQVQLELLSAALKWHAT